MCFDITLKRTFASAAFRILHEQATNLIQAAMQATTIIAILLLTTFTLSPAFSFSIQNQSGSPFSTESLQPGIPSSALNSSYSLLQEVSSWRDLSVFAILITQQPTIFQTLDSSSNTVLVPDDEAILGLFELVSGPIPPNQPPPVVAETVIEVFSRLETDSFPMVPSLPELLQYHVIPEVLSEPELVEESLVEARFGPPLNFSNYPNNIQDEDPVQKAFRFARQISTPTGRISIISSLLIPLNVRKTLQQFDVPLPKPPSPRARTLFTPLRSLLTFVSGRNDLIVLSSLLSSSKMLRDSLALSADPLYLFAPNDFAFVQLVRLLLPENFAQRILKDVDAALVNTSRTAVALESGEEVGVREALGHTTKIENFVTRLASQWEEIKSVSSDVPSLEELVLYHLLNTSSSCDELISAGPQRTLFTNDVFLVTEITVTEQGVQDASERAPANIITSLATRNGFASVLDSVLLPFSVEGGRATIAAALGVATPTPDETPVETLEAPESPGAVPTEPSVIGGTPTATVIPSMVPSPETQTPEPSLMTPPPDETMSLETVEAEPSPLTTPADPGSGGGPVGAGGPSGVPSPEDEEPVCFPSDSRIRLRDGRNIRMDELEAGSHVHIGDGKTSKVFLFTHRQSNVKANFVRIHTASGHRVSLTPGHYLYANGRLTAAVAVREGDQLDSEDGVTTVVRTERISLIGLYAPHTIHGDIMVDGVRVSGYSTALHPVVAQALLAPLRYLATRGWNEPLGNLFYGGADHFARLLPRGSYVY